MTYKKKQGKFYLRPTVLDEGLIERADVQEELNCLDTKDIELENNSMNDRKYE